MKGTIEPKADRIALDRYVIESSYITQYLSRIVKDKALVIYHVLFHLWYFETGKAVIVIPWANVGAYIRSEQGNIIQDSSTVTRRLTDLLQCKCISVNRRRGGANEICVHLPSEIQVCRELIQQDQAIPAELERVDNADYYTDPERRIQVLERDKRRCTYCLLAISEDSFVLDHLVPVSKGGTNRKHNLVASCESCNQRKQDQDPVDFIQSNYRDKLISQKEFMDQKAYIETLLLEGQVTIRHPMNS